MAGDDDSDGDDGEESRPDDDDRSGSEDRFGTIPMREWSCRLPLERNRKRAFRFHYPPVVHGIFLIQAIMERRRHRPPFGLSGFRKIIPYKVFRALSYSPESDETL
jgi:hypothetical protein